jgi:hypothetical protein
MHYAYVLLDFITLMKFGEAASVRVPGYRSKGPVSIPGTTTFSEK